MAFSKTRGKDKTFSLWEKRYKMLIFTFLWFVLQKDKKV